MNPIEQLASQLSANFAAVSLRVEIPRNGGAPAGWLDAKWGERHVTVELLRTGELGVSTLPTPAEPPTTGLFDGPDVVVAAPREAALEVLDRLGIRSTRPRAGRIAATL